MTEAEVRYFARRAREEREAADASTKPEAASVHIALAERYEALIGTYCGDGATRPI
jgi:hypothetical protein